VNDHHRVAQINSGTCCKSEIITSLYRIRAPMLIIMAVLSLFTGARTSIVFFKISPVVKTTVAVLFLVGTVV